MHVWKLMNSPLISILSHVCLARAASHSPVFEPVMVITGENSSAVALEPPTHSLFLSLFLRGVHMASENIAIHMAGNASENIMIGHGGDIGI